jgi:hypothetical protein
VKKVLALLVVAIIIAAACGTTWVSKYVDNLNGDFYLAEFDQISGGNELIVLNNQGSQSSSVFAKQIIAQNDGDGGPWMTKGEYVYLQGNADPSKFEEVEWWKVGCTNPANAYINKYTETADLSQQQVLTAEGSAWGSDTMSTVTDANNYIYEVGQVVIWHGDPNACPGVFDPINKNPLPKPELPPIPDP